MFRNWIRFSLPLLGAALIFGGTGSAFAAGTHHAARPNIGVQNPTKLQGQVTEILQPSAFVMSVTDGLYLAMNVTANTKFIGEQASTITGPGGLAGLGAGTNVTVGYRVTASGDVASEVTLASAIQGKPRTLKGMILTVSSTSLTLAKSAGATAAIALTPTTKYIPVGIPTASAGQMPQANDYAVIRAAAVNGALDAIEVRFGPRPWGLSRSTAKGTITAVGATSITIQPSLGVSLPIDMLNDTVITINRQAATLALLKVGDKVTVTGWRFDGAMYAARVAATAASTTPTGNGQTLSVPIGTTLTGTIETVTAYFKDNASGVLVQVPLATSTVQSGSVVFVPPAGLAAGSYTVYAVLTYEMSNSTTGQWTTPTISYTVD